MEFIIGFFTNRLFIVVACAWFTAQLVKTFLYAIVNKTFNAERILGAGGMPSSHSASVIALVLSTAYMYGTNGFEFAIAAILGSIVIYDARGVRKESGKHAVLLNKLSDYFQQNKDENPLDMKKPLNEFIGHSGMQIIAGMLVGIVIAVIFIVAGFLPKFAG